MPHAKVAKDAKASEEIFLCDLRDLCVRLFQQAVRHALNSDRRRKAGATTGAARTLANPRRSLLSVFSSGGMVVAVKTPLLAGFGALPLLIGGSLVLRNRNNAEAQA